jgi:transcriptional regulator with XRE-family HTH domain
MSNATRILIACYTRHACDVDILPVRVYQRSVTSRDPIYKHIGELIKSRRKTLKLKQETLALMLGISRGSLANIETGRQNILVHNLYKFAAVLKLKPFDLLPQPSSNQTRTEHVVLPLPDDLKAEQKKQVAHLFMQVDTNQTKDKKISRAKTINR